MATMADISYDEAREIENSSQRYEYPNGLDLKPGSELHDRIVKMVMDCAQSGYDTTNDYVDEYERMDNVLDGYMPADEVDRMRKLEDDRRPVNVVIPMLTAHRELFLAAMHRAFFSGELFHRYKGEGTPERAAKAYLAGKVGSRVSQWFKERRAADIHWGNSFVYGRSFAWGKWSKRTSPSLVDTEIDDLLSAVLGGMGVQIPPGERVRILDETVQQRREGTDWIPLDNYQVFTDPDTPPDRFQESSFFGWVVRTDALLLRETEDDPEEYLFNCVPLELLARKGRGDSTLYRNVSARKNRLGNPGEPTQHSQSSRCDVIHMFMRLIPQREGLGDGTRPEIWHFAVGGDRILIQADRVHTRHGGIPCICAAPNERGHEISPVSNLMLTYGQQIAVDFLVKRRLDFQDTMLNGKFAVNPDLAEWRDFKAGGGPMVVRLKKKAVGRDLREIFHQFDVTDVTAGNWMDVGNLMQLAKEGNGITEQASELPERPTATGIQAIEGRSIGRMARIALNIDEQSRQPMAYQNLCNLAQWMSTEVILDITGREDEIIRQAYGLPPEATGLLASAWDIDPDLDVVPLSSMSTGPNNMSAMTEFAKTLLGAPGATEFLFSKFRFEEFLTAYFREMGISDIDWYRRGPEGMNITPVPEDMLQQQVQAGNLVPMGVGGGTGT